MGGEGGGAEGALEVNTVTVEQIVPVPHVRQFVREIEQTIADAEQKDDIVEMRGVLMRVRDRIKSFVEGLTGAAPVTNQEAKALVEELTRSLEQKKLDEERMNGAITKARKEIAEAREAGFAAERDVVELEGNLREVQARLAAANAARSNVASLRQRFEEEVREGIALVGAAVHSWEKSEIPQGALSEDRREQEKRHRDIERLKIKIEESGIGNGEAVVKEFSQTKERDEFLARELNDLENSAASLKDIIVELEKTIDARFHEGLKHINEALGGFF